MHIQQQKMSLFKNFKNNSFKKKAFNWGLAYSFTGLVYGPHVGKHVSRQASRQAWWQGSSQELTSDSEIAVIESQTGPGVGFINLKVHL